MVEPVKLRPDRREWLVEVGYTMPCTCDACRWGTFVSIGSWGSCRKHERRNACGRYQLSVHRCGVCPEYDPHPDKLARMQGLEELLEPLP